MFKATEGIKRKFTGQVNTGTSGLVKLFLWTKIFEIEDGLIVGNDPYREEGSVVTIWVDDEMTDEKDGLKVG